MSLILGAMQQSEFNVLYPRRAVYGFCEHLKASRNTAVLTPMLPVITDSLLNLAVMFSNEVLSLVMETLAMVLAVDKDFTSTCEPKVGPLTIALFLKHNSGESPFFFFKQFRRFPD